MVQKELSELTDEELLKEWKKVKTGNIIMAVLIGLMIATSVYGAVKKGLTFFTFFPLILVVFFVNAQKKNKEVEKEVKLRNLK